MRNSRISSQDADIHERRQRAGTGTPEQLMDAVSRGDERAFESLYDHLAPAVMSVVIAVVRDRVQSEEVTLEVFVELWRTAARYHPNQGGILAWAVTVAHRRAADRVRTTRTGTRREPSPELQRVHHCLQTLTATQREAVSLTYYQAWTYREIAEALDIPLGMVKTRTQAGVVHLHDALTLETRAGR